MGLLSSPRRVLRTPGFKLPIRLHSEHRVSVATATAVGRISGRIASLGAAAFRDARVVGALLVASLAALVLVAAASLR